MPKVSTIIPTYNRSTYVVSAIDSASNQTYIDHEIIVVDDGSLDNTKEILRPYIESGKIRYFYQENKGPAAARNKGIREARGEYISFLDSDDKALPNKLEEQVKILDENKNIGLVYGKILIEDINKGTLRNFGLVFPGTIPCHEMFLNLLKYHLFFSICTVTMRREIAARYKFDPRMKIGEDFLFFLQVSRDYMFYGVNKPFAIISRGHNSLMSNEDRFDVKKCLDILLHDKHDKINMSKLLYLQSVSQMYLYFSKVNIGQKPYKYLKSLSDNLE